VRRIIREKKKALRGNEYDESEDDKQPYGGEDEAVAVRGMVGLGAQRRPGAQKNLAINNGEMSTGKFIAS
jgi:hypothetical protein